MKRLVKSLFFLFLAIFSSAPSTAIGKSLLGTYAIKANYVYETKLVDGQNWQVFNSLRQNGNLTVASKALTGDGNLFYLIDKNLPIKLSFPKDPIKSQKTYANGGAGKYTTADEKWTIKTQVLIKNKSGKNWASITYTGTGCYTSGAYNGQCLNKFTWVGSGYQK